MKLIDEVRKEENIKKDEASFGFRECENHDP